MSAFLRFTRDEYGAITGAFATVQLRGGHRAFGRALAAALLAGGHLILAARVAGLGARLARVLREHLEAARDAAQSRPRARARREGQALSFEEWRAVSDAHAVVALRCDSPDGFKDALVGEVGRMSPALAARLGRLDEGQAAALYRSLKSGRRWCG